MKSQWMLISGFIFALIIAIFAIANVGSVEFNYLFGKTDTPLILIILISTLFGGLTVGSIGMFRTYIVSKQLKQYEKEWKLRGLEPLPEPTSVFKTKAKLQEKQATDTHATEGHNTSQDSSPNKDGWEKEH